MSKYHGSVRVTFFRSGEHRAPAAGSRRLQRGERRGVAVGARGGIVRTLCRDCGAVASSEPGERCAPCGSPRLVSHAELGSLSIAHVDCDAFYAAVEKRDRPELADRPVIIGGGARGVL